MPRVGGSVAGSGRGTVRTRAQTPHAVWSVVPRSIVRKSATVLRDLYVRPLRELIAYTRAAATPLEGILAFVAYRRTLCALCRERPRSNEFGGRYCSQVCADADAHLRGIA
jgi:hypothetical protein